MANTQARLIKKGDKYSATALAIGEESRDIAISVKVTHKMNSANAYIIKELYEEAVEEWFLDCTTLVPDHLIYSVEVPSYPYPGERNMTYRIEISVYSRKELKRKGKMFKKYFEGELERLTELVRLDSEVQA